MLEVRRPLALALSATALLIATGCGDGPPSVDSSNTEATVKGVVRINGAPAKAGEIVFDPTNIRRQNVATRTARIGPDGTYTVTTLTGPNLIRIQGAIINANPSLQGISRGFDVKSGENTFDFEAKADK